MHSCRRARPWTFDKLRSSGCLDLRNAFGKHPVLGGAGSRNRVGHYLHDHRAVGIARAAATERLRIRLGTYVFDARNRTGRDPVHADKHRQERVRQSGVWRDGRVRRLHLPFLHQGPRMHQPGRPRLLPLQEGTEGFLEFSQDRLAGQHEDAACRGVMVFPPVAARNLHHDRVNRHN